MFKTVSGFKTNLTKPFVKSTKSESRSAETLPPLPFKLPLDVGAPRILVIGAGSRGCVYANALTHPPPNVNPEDIVSGVVVGVAEPDEGKRRRFISNYVLKGGSAKADQSLKTEDGEDYLEFRDWKEMITEEGKQMINKVGVDGVLICTLDHTHAEILLSLRSHHPTVHLFSEKPLTSSLPSLFRLHAALGPQLPIIFSIGHVLRYSSLLLTLKKLLCEDEAIGSIIHIDWTEPVGHWHFAHSYVRGNWAESASSAPSLLTKCCHDIDVLMWLLCSPHYQEQVETEVGEEGLRPRPTHAGTPGRGIRKKPHLPARITSTGSLVHFRKRNKPKKAGDATNCFNCAAEQECFYSAKKIYIKDHGLSKGWPNKIVSPDIEDLSLPRDYQKAVSLLTNVLTQDYSTPEDKGPGKSYYGRCVYEAGNDVVDSQVVTLSWDDEGEEEGEQQAGYSSKSATLTMIAHSEAICERRGRIYGSRGEIAFSSETNSITVYDFASGNLKRINPHEALGSGHGGGDFGMMNAFVGAVRAVKCLGWDVHRAQKEWIGADVEECVRGHAIVWAAEEARVGQKVVVWGDWWENLVGEKKDT
ncbi:hypothetical protein BDZ91DRAFT_321471 [Kalaharituber pfeilii]|nr:hypothetical protein BDZ91DRAFT_321471 [Kalaharituber pfeilii]